jgi:hypothetical protein
MRLKNQHSPCIHETSFNFKRISWFKWNCNPQYLIFIKDCAVVTEQMLLVPVISMLALERDYESRSTTSHHHLTFTLFSLDPTFSFHLKSFKHTFTNKFPY